MRGLSEARLYHSQDFDKLRTKCLKENVLFEDPEFPANAKSLGFDKDVEWKRPTDLVDDPEFMLDVNRFSVVQGELGDCWFVSALSAITLNRGLLCRVVPRDQDFTTKYAGIFHFRLWQGGEWVDVVVDDLLPVIHGVMLCFSHSIRKEEFWSALLEKAYAKLHGTYGALNSGKSYEATEDLTGGVTERFHLHSEDCPHNLFSLMVKASQRGSLLTCSLSGGKEEKQVNGLVSGHSYCITGARRIRVIAPRKPYVDLVRIRNPWGDENEWQGAWGDESKEWGLVPEEEKKKLKLTVDADGEFWMMFKDFQKNFDEVFITSLNPDTLNQEARNHLHDFADVVNEVVLSHKDAKSSQNSSKREWEVVHYDGSWVRNASAGGPPNDKQLFSTNPQYLLQLTEADDDTDGESGMCTVVLSLMQKHRRINNLPLHAITTCVYKVEDNEDVPSPLPPSWLRFNRPVEEKVKLTRTRTVTQRLHLKPGRYILIPCASGADLEAEFLLRVFCEKKSTIEENDQEAMLLDIQEKGEDVLDAVGEDEPPTAELLKEVYQDAAGEDSGINGKKLLQILTQLFPDVEFTLDLCRSLLAMMDEDLSGNIDYYELQTLVQSLAHWRNVYKSKRNEESGLLSGRAWGLGDALKTLGYQVPRRLQALVVVRYGDVDGNISLADFIMAICRISVMLERFDYHSDDSEKKASIRLSKWLQYTLYC